MNHFELFEIPEQVQVNQAELSKKYFELSRKYHPDHHAGRGDEMEILNKAAQLNKAYQVLKSEDETIRYILMQKELMEDEEKYQLSPDFLMEVLEINEQLMEAGEDPDLTSTLKKQIATLYLQIREPVESIITQYQSGIGKEELLLLKDYYYRKKYLDRISRELGAKS